MSDAESRRFVLTRFRKTLVIRSENKAAEQLPAPLISHMPRFRAESQIRVLVPSDDTQSDQ